MSSSKAKHFATKGLCKPKCSRPKPPSLVSGKACQGKLLSVKGWKCCLPPDMFPTERGRFASNNEQTIMNGSFGKVKGLVRDSALLFCTKNLGQRPRGPYRARSTDLPPPNRFSHFLQGVYAAFRTHTWYLWKAIGDRWQERRLKSVSCPLAEEFFLVLNHLGLGPYYAEQK